MLLADPVTSNLATLWPSSFETSLCSQWKGTNRGDEHTSIDSVSEYLPGCRLQQTESQHEGCFHMYIQWVRPPSPWAHPMFLVSPHPSLFVLLPCFSTLFQGLPNGVLVCLLLYTVVDILQNADKYVADRRSCCPCGTPFLFQIALQIPHHAYHNSVIILSLSWIMTYLQCYQRLLGVSTLLSFRTNFTLTVSVNMSWTSLASSFLFCNNRGIDIWWWSWSPSPFFRCYLCV